MTMDRARYRGIFLLSDEAGAHERKNNATADA